MADFKVGQTIETNDGRRAIVRYVGDIHVAAGTFCGVELPTPTGKNDGSVKGVRYFTCDPDHGLFVKPSGIARIISEPPSIPRAGSPRKSMAKPPRPALRPTSISGPTKAPMRPAAATNRLSTVTSPPQPATRPPVRKSSVSTVTSTPSANRISRASISAPRPSPSTTSTATAKSSRQSLANSKDAATIDTLETKLRHLEKQYTEAKEQLKELDRIQGDRSRFEGLVQKLQSKCQTFHQENVELKAAMKRTESEMDRLSRAEQEHESILELATLDKEMAEERAEQAEAELQMLRDRLEEKELELDILQSEASLVTEDMTDEAKEAAGYFKLQRENERFKDALIRLKEITEEKEAEFKQQIRELEADVAEVEKLREEKSRLEALATEQEEAIDQLRAQVDTDNSWGEMVEELSYKTQQQAEQLAEKDQIIRDLEALKELNDEIAEHQMEQANDLRAELDERETELAERVRIQEEQDVTIAEQETLIAKFRDFVADMQARMSDAESSKMMTEEQAKDVNARFNEVMELNRRLQNANLTSIGKTITSELQKLAAQEAQEELSVVRQYLAESPDVYQNSSLRSYFCVKRIDFKSNLTCSLLTSAGVRPGGPDDADRFTQDLFRYDMVHQLTVLGLKSAMLSSTVSTSSVEQFNFFAFAFEELAPVERTVDRCLDSIKTDELNCKDTSATVRRIGEILATVVRKYQEGVPARPEDEIIFRVSAMKSSFELIKSSFETLALSVDTFGIEQDEPGNLLQTIMETIRKPSTEATDNVLAVDKLLRTLQALREDSLYPDFPLGVDDLIANEEKIARAAQAAHRFATQVGEFVKPKPEQDSLSMLASELAPFFNKQKENLLADHSDLSNLSDFTQTINSWNEFGSVLRNNIEIERGPAPWVLKSKELQATKMDRAEAEEKIQQILGEHRNALVQVREKDELIEIKDLEIEHLKAKTREAAAKVVELAHADEELDKQKKQYAKFEADVKKDLEELRRLKEERREWEYYAAKSKQQNEGMSEGDLEKLAEPKRRDTAPQARLSDASSFATLVSALENENHWLRRRENAEMFSLNLRDMLAKSRDFQQTMKSKLGQPKVDEILDLAWNLEGAKLAPIQTSQVAPSEPPSKNAPLLALPHLATREVRSPVVLSREKSPLKWTPRVYAPERFINDIENFEFADLSPIGKDVWGEMDDELVGLNEMMFGSFGVVA